MYIAKESSYRTPFLICQYSSHTNWSSCCILTAMKTTDISLIIFDCDGTLVDTESLSAVLITEMLNQLSIPISLEDCKARFMGTKFSDIHAFAVRNGIDINAEEFEKDYRSKCNEIFTRDLKPIPGVLNMLDQLNVPFCIASNGPKEKMKITLRAAGIHNYFNEAEIYSAYDLQKWKPLPDLFLNAADMLNHQPENCLVVEDTIHGIEAAIAANMKVVGVNIKHQESEIREMGVPVYSDIIDLSNGLSKNGLLG